MNPKIQVDEDKPLSFTNPAEQQGCGMRGRLIRGGRKKGSFRILTDLRMG